jgi:hypothetical protein
VVPFGEIDLHFIDGQRGDDDLKANGTIVDAGGPFMLPKPNAAELYVTQLYRALLNRDPESAGLQAWTQWLAAGASRLDIARGIYDSAEHRGFQVDQFYERYLHRAADSTGRAFWVNSMRRGTDETAIEQAFFRSSEYARSHPNAGAFVRGLCQDVYGSSPTSQDIAFWVKRVGTPPDPAIESSASTAFLTSTVRQRNQVDGFYTTFLGRPADPAGGAKALALLQSRLVNPEQLVEMVLISEEFWRNSQAMSN